MMVTEIAELRLSIGKIYHLLMGHAKNNEAKAQPAANCLHLVHIKLF